MQNEEQIKQELISNFPFLQDKIEVKRERRIWAQVDSDKFWGVFDHVINMMSFTMLLAVTGLDEGERFGFIYHLAKENGIMLMIKTSIPKDSVLQTVTKYFPSAEIYEREIADLLGVNVSGLQEGNRYPLPDDWPKDVYPLRKDFDQKVLDQKEGCK